MTPENQTREMQNIEQALGLLDLTEKNQNLARQYMDMSVPEDTGLLKEVEHQNFEKISHETECDFRDFLKLYRKTRTELAGRFIRLVVEIGGESARKVVTFYTSSDEFEYLGKFLTPIQRGVIRASAAVRNNTNLNNRFIQPLIRMGIQDPEVFSQMRELCYNEERANTQMLLAALYLHCVKPCEETKGALCILAEQDSRTEGTPGRIREMTAYLEHCLIKNIDKLFADGSEPEAAELEILQNFVQNAALTEPIPDEVRTILSGRRTYSYQMAFQPLLAFLAVEHSDRFVSILRLADALDFMAVNSSPLDTCLEAGQDWFDRHILALEQYLIMPGDMFIRWALSHRQTKILEHMAAKSPDDVCAVFEDVAAGEKAYLIDCVKAGSPKLYEERKKMFAGQFRQAVVGQVSGIYSVSKDEARRYLLGLAEISDILCCAQDWRDMHTGVHWTTICENIHQCKLCGEMQVYKRALILEWLRLNTTYISNYWVGAELDPTEYASKYKDIDVRQMNSILNLLEEEKMPPRYQIEFLSVAYDGRYYAPYYEENAYQNCLEALISRHRDWHDEWKEASQSHFQPARILAIRVMSAQWQEYKCELLACAAESSNDGRELIHAVYTAHPDCEKDMLAMLKSLRSLERMMAVEVLAAWGVEKYQSPLTEALHSEKTKKLRVLIQDTLGDYAGSGDEQNASEQPIEALVKEILTGSWKRKLAWLPLDTFPTVHKQDKEQASADFLAAILVSYADMKELGINKDAKRLAAMLNPSELALYIKEVYRYWLTDGAQAKRKWVLYATAIHGGGTIVAELYAQLQDWAKNARGAMAAEAVRAMALNPAPTALVQVDQIARKFKPYQVKKAAEDALGYAAQQLGITREELEDRIVPDLGFDTQMERIFDYGKRQFKVILTPALTLEVYDEKGKQLKNMPAPGKTDDPDRSKDANDAWKFLKKQLKTVITAQKLRMEQALGSGRQWQADSWRALFVQNPVMHQFATGLIWGVYQGKESDRTLLKTFRYMEDGTFNTADEEEYALPDMVGIGLVHPLELSEEELAAWRQQLLDYEIVQPFEQFDRPVFRVTEEEKDQSELTRFGGVVVNALSLSGKLQNMGWYKGSVGDGGSFDTYYRCDQDKDVELDFSGDAIASLDMDVVIYGARFGRSGASGGMANCSLGEVDPRYFSEIVLQLTRACASSTERQPYPTCKNGKWY